MCHRAFLVFSIKCDGPEAGPYLDSLSYVSFMSILFALGIPLYYVLALYKVRGAINTPLPSILKDKDYITAFALAGHKFIDNEGKRMSGEQLGSARKVVRDDWVQRNPELAASLEGKDYKSQYEHVRARAGVKKAKDFIKRKARAASVPAHRFKFLWGPYRVKLWYFEVLDMFRRFLVLGLPKILSAMAPNAGIEIYIGLLVMAVSPVIYSQMDPYISRNDHHLMILTQLAQTVVVLCGMVRENVKGNTSNLIVTVIIMVTLCPMFLVLVLFVWDPSGRTAKRIFHSLCPKRPEKNHGPIFCLW